MPTSEEYNDRVREYERARMELIAAANVLAHYARIAGQYAEKVTAADKRMTDAVMGMFEPKELHRPTDVTPGLDEREVG